MRRLILCLITVGLLLGLSAVVKAFTFTTFSVPGSVGTFGLGINNNGVVVGGFLIIGYYVNAAMCVLRTALSR
jgi:hypothetical protein